MRNVSIRLKYRLKPVDAVIMITAFSMFSISYLTYISTLIHAIYYFFQISIILYGILSILAYRKYDVMDLLVLSYVAVEFISTFLNRGAFKELILSTKTLLFLYAAFKWVFSWKPQMFVRVIARYSLLVTILNTITAVISYPRGLFYFDKFTPAFLLGADNTSTRLYIIATLMCFLDAFYGKKKNILPLLSIANFTCYVFLRDIGNGKICVLVLITAYLVFHVIGISMPSKPMAKIITGNYILFFILVVFEWVRLFEYIIVSLLQRNLTLTNRTIIWEITLEKIAENPILGNGYVSGTQFESLLPSIIGVNAHNTILMIGFTGGIILSIIFAKLMYGAVKQYDKISPQTNMWFVPACFLAMFLRSQIEGGDEAYLIAMAAIVANVAKEYFRREKGLVEILEIRQGV